MLKNWRIAVFFALIVAFAIWIQWWASLGFPLEHEICSEPKSSEDCGSYNIVFYSAWVLAKAVDHYSALITALATGAIGYFTFTLKQSTDKLWRSSEDTLKHARSEASQAKLDRYQDNIRFNEQTDISREAANAATHAASSAVRQAHVAEETLSKIERPYLFISNVSKLQIEQFFDFDTDTVGHLLNVTYDVANHGKIPAIVESVRASLSAFKEPLDPVLADFDHPLITAPILASGEKRADLTEGTTWEDMGTDEAGNTIPNFGHDTLFLRVVVCYRGPFTNGHETSIGLRYDERTRRFVEFHSGEKYNYQT